MTAETAAILRDAKALIADPKHWIKGEYARRIDGRQCYCAVGALESVVTPFPEYKKAWDALNAAMTRTGVAEFNDRSETGHADVMAAFDRAIAAEEAEVPA